MSGFRSFVVPTDFSAHAQAALDTACDLAQRLSARVRLVHVLEPPSAAYGYAPHPGSTMQAPVETGGLRESTERALREERDRLGPQAPVETEVVEGAGVAGTLQAYAAERGADLIVMGTHGRTGLAHVFLGSVAERTLRGAPCPVLTVRAAAD